jgi:hypothetical protein
MTEVTTTNSSEVAYAPFLNFLKIRNKRSLPNEQGIYVLCQGSRIYCGRGKDLSERVPVSAREQGFGDIVYFYPASFMDIANNTNLRTFLGQLESDCISALFTIIHGNGLPFNLTNKNDAYPLPPSAWSTAGDNEFSLAIKIAQTVLHRNGVPSVQYGLPNYEILFSNITQAIAAENAGRWGEIVASELKTLEAPDYPKAPLICIEFSRKS